MVLRQQVDGRPRVSNRPMVSNRPRETAGRW
jgi:hypothetical protein